MPEARQQALSELQFPRHTKMSNSRPLSHLWLNSFAVLICMLCSGLASTNAAANFFQIAPTGSEHGGYSNGGTDDLSLPLLRLRRDLYAKMMLEAPNVKELPSTAEPPTLIVDQPQGQCLLDGILVLETSVSCMKQMGCRAIQKTGYCCPDYKCDCQKDGITYLNGDKLVDPETPCTVCYCQGGEILCSSVTCFHRDDCKPKYIAGRCCPEYNNCPVSVPDPIHNSTKSNDYPVEASEVKGATVTPTSTIPPVVAPKITIKEITKPIEIRITDDNKAIPIHQMLKPQSTSTSTTSTATPITNAAESTTEAKATIAADDSFTQTPTTGATANASALTPHTPITATELEHNQSGEIATITTNSAKPTSSASAGNKTKLSTDNNRQTALPAAVGINNGESLKLSASVAYPSTERNTVTVIIPPNIGYVENGSGSDSSEVLAEVAPLIEDGSVLSEFGAQELQHDASSNDPTKVNIKRENLATTERSTGEGMGGGEEYASPEVLDGKDEGAQSGGLQLQGTFDLEPETSGSDNIYHIILTTSGPRYDGTTEGYGEFKAVGDLQHSLAAEIQVAASNQQESVVLAPPHKSNTTDTPYNTTSTTKSSKSNISTTAVTPRTKSTPINNTAATTDGPESASSTPVEAAKHTTESGHHHMDDEETAMPMDTNPAYPSLPEDDFSLRDTNFPLTETEDVVETDLKDEQRSIGGAFDISKSHKTTEEGSGSGIELIEGSSTPAYESMNNDSTTEMASKVPAKVALLNSAEDLSAETAISNSSDFQLNNFTSIARVNDTKDVIDSEEVEVSSETGSGDSLEDDKKSYKRREPTTPRPTQRAALEVDIDELGVNIASGDGKSDSMDDPKLDAESIKADENVEEGIIKQEAGHKEDVLTVNAKPAEERTVEELPAAVVGSATLGRLQRMFLQRFV